MTVNDEPCALKNLGVGERKGFLMQDAVRIFGGLGQASSAIALLLAEGLIDSEPAVINGDVHTLYRLTNTNPPTLH